MIDTELEKNGIANAVQQMRLYDTSIIEDGIRIESGVADVFGDLRRMHRYYGFHLIQMTRERLEERIKFQIEELQETLVAVQESKPEEVVDGLIDQIVVASGTLDMLDVDSDLAWLTVMRANMAKKVGTNPKRPNSKGIDLIKPEGWTAPSHSGNTGCLEHLFQTEDSKISGVDLLLVDLDVEEDIKFSKLNLKDSEDIVKESKGLFNSLETISVDMIGEKAKECREIFLAGRRFIPEDSLPVQNLSFQVVSQDQPNKRDSVLFLEECIQLQIKKAKDYQADESSITQADYYPRGIDDIVYMLHVKLTRIKSVLDKVRVNRENVMFESIEDSFKDMVNYASFAGSWLRGKLEGQDVDKKDIFNRQRREK